MTRSTRRSAGGAAGGEGEQTARALNPYTLEGLSASRLKEELKARGLDTTGNKQKLVCRLQDAILLERAGGSVKTEPAEQEQAVEESTSTSQADGDDDDLPVVAFVDTRASTPPPSATPPPPKTKSGRKRKVSSLVEKNLDESATSSALEDTPARAGGSSTNNNANNNEDDDDDDEEATPTIRRTSRTHKPKVFDDDFETPTKRRSVAKLKQAADGDEAEEPAVETVDLYDDEGTSAVDDQPAVAEKGEPTKRSADNAEAKKSKLSKEITEDKAESEPVEKKRKSAGKDARCSTQPQSSKNNDDDLQIVTPAAETSTLSKEAKSLKRAEKEQKQKQKRSEKSTSPVQVTSEKKRHQNKEKSDKREKGGASAEFAERRRETSGSSRTSTDTSASTKSKANSTASAQLKKPAPKQPKTETPAEITVIDDVAIDLATDDDDELMALPVFSEEPAASASKQPKSVAHRKQQARQSGSGTAASGSTGISSIDDLFSSISSTHKRNEPAASVVKPRFYQKTPAQIENVKIVETKKQDKNARQRRPVKTEPVESSSPIVLDDAPAAAASSSGAQLPPPPPPPPPPPKPTTSTDQVVVKEEPAEEQSAAAGNNAPQSSAGDCEPVSASEQSIDAEMTSPVSAAEAPPSATSETDNSAAEDWDEQTAAPPPSAATPHSATGNKHQFFSEVAMALTQKISEIMPILAQKQRQSAEQLQANQISAQSQAPASAEDSPATASTSTPSASASTPGTTGTPAPAAAPMEAPQFNNDQLKTLVESVTSMKQRQAQAASEMVDSQWQARNNAQNQPVMPVASALPQPVTPSDAAGDDPIIICQIPASQADDVSTSSAPIKLEQDGEYEILDEADALEAAGGFEMDAAAAILKVLQGEELPAPLPPKNGAKKSNEPEAPELESNEPQIDFHNSDLHVKMVPSNRYQLEPETKDGFALMWANARGSHAVFSGKVVYQVKVIEHMPVNVPFEEPHGRHDVRVGWSARREGVPVSLGEYDYSYAYCGSAKKATKSRFETFGAYAEPGDVITCCFDLDAGRIAFALNDGPLQTAFEDVVTRVVKREAEESAISESAAEPGAVSLSQQDASALNVRDDGRLFWWPQFATRNTRLEVNFGQQGAWLPVPEGYSLLNDLAGEQRVASEQQPAADKKQQCTVLMMVGLPGVGKSTWVREYLKEHPDEHWVLISPDAVIDMMKVQGQPRHKVHTSRWDVVMGLVAKAINRIISLACRRKRNYIIDQTNTSLHARRRKLLPFREFRRLCAVIVPSDAQYDARRAKREAELGTSIPPEAMSELKGLFVLPSPDYEPYIDEVHFIEPAEEELPAAHRLVEQYNKEGRPWYSNRHGYRYGYGGENFGGVGGRFGQRGGRGQQGRGRGGGRGGRGGGGGGRYQRQSESAASETSAAAPVQPHHTAEDDDTVVNDENQDIENEEQSDDEGSDEDKAGGAGEGWSKGGAVGWFSHKSKQPASSTTNNSTAISADPQ